MYQMRKEVSELMLFALLKQSFAVYVFLDEIIHLYRSKVFILHYFHSHRIVIEENLKKNRWGSCIKTLIQSKLELFANLNFGRFHSFLIRYCNFLVTVDMECPCWEMRNATIMKFICMRHMVFLDIVWQLHSFDILSRTVRLCG